METVVQYVRQFDNGLAPCTTCGKPSTSFAQDLTEKMPEDGAPWREYEKDGPPRFGCDEHPVKAEAARKSKPLPDPDWEMLYDGPLVDGEW